MRASEWSRLVLSLALTTPVSYVAHAEVYLNEKQAAEILFPGIVLNSSWVELTAQDLKTIEKLSGKKWLSSRVRVFWGPAREALVIDRVYGKHEFITYAVAINSDGKIKGIEIMEYRETYGSQVCGSEWRKQFIGKGPGDLLKVERDIKNISGATLSSVHITDGVRRVVHTYEIIKEKI